MTGNRRVVRVTDQFFDDLDRQLDAERGPNGEPSVNDFNVYELLEIVERFATGFDDLPQPIEGRSDYRMLITAGVLVPRYSIIGQLAPDDAVELIQIELDLDAGW